MVTRYYYEFTSPHRKTQEKLSERYVSDRTVTATMSPSGRIAIGVVPKPKELQKDKEYEGDRPTVSTFLRCHWDKNDGIVKERVTVVDDCPPPLGLSAVPNHHKPERARYGLRGITLNGRNKVFEGAALLQQRYRGRLGFYTLTCPYKDSSLIYEFNRNIGEITRRWFQELRRFYARLKVTFSYVMVLEIQSDRYEESGIPVVHLHYVAPCYLPGTREWVLSATELRYLWMRCLSSVLGVEADTSPSVDAQVVKKSASGYLAKYLSKGYGMCEWIADICPSQLPKQWWSMSANVKRCLRRLTTQIPQPLAEWWFGGNNFDEGEAYHLTYKKDIYVQWKGMELRVGMSAQICKEGAARLIDPFKWLQSMWEL